MDSLSNVQEATRAAIIRAIANYEKTPKERLSVSYIETRLEMLEQHWQLFFKTHFEIISTIDQSELHGSDYYNNDVYEEVEELYVDHKSDLKERLTVLIKDSDASSSSESRVESSSFRLPEIKVPIFSGNYVEWQPFKELFLGLIHENKLLNDTQKLYYLKSHLWKKLETMYDNKRFLTNNILNRLLNQNSLTSESASQLKRLVSITSDCLEALKNIGIDVSSWDSIIVHIVSRKLDKDTRKAWELSLSSKLLDELVSLEEFIQFLTNRFRGLENIGNVESHTCKNTKVPQLFSYHVLSGSEEKPKAVNSCNYCKSNHTICECTKFRQESNDTRREFARDNGLCFICLNNNHSAKACKTNFRCHKCKKQHHTLLHPSGTGHSAGDSSSVGNRSVVEAEGAVKSFIATTCNKSYRSLRRLPVPGRK
ncbi:hypothetical protein ABMA27_013182 [Loxostege sticticalis]|uniref:Uncharacterized protein n=1 Tax=Loxostege sticticalis TaxID=481309 RepID=A0ABR3IED5_LOXSC